MLFLHEHMSGMNLFYYTFRMIFAPGHRMHSVYAKEQYQPSSFCVAWEEEGHMGLKLSCTVGLMTAEELRQLEELPSPHNKFWVPCMWFVSLAMRARSEGRINNDVAMTAILNVCLSI